MEWDGATYETFRAARGRPLRDLVAHIPRPPVGSIVDAGCGTGRTSHDLASWFRQAHVIGIDRSARMVGLARPAGRVTFQQADLRAWNPDAPVDLVVANAVLHWLSHPAAAFRHLASWAPNGTVAVQVPANFDQPSHRIVRETAEAMGLPPSPAQDIPLQAPPSWLSDRIVDAWETTYVHLLTGTDPVLRWLSGTTLRPYLGQGKENDQAFLDALRKPLADAYPMQGDATPFPFTRRFWVATPGAGQD